MPHFNIEVCFLAGRYGGAEWPPAPMRLLQALVAGVRNGTDPALEWLEGLGPPTILAEADPVGATVRTFVPNNTASGTLATPTEKADRYRQIRRPRTPVRYCWRFDADDQPLSAAASAAAEKLHTLGTGHDMCSARAWVSDDALSASEPDRALWRPSTLPAGISAGGVQLRVPMIGSLGSIEARFQAGRQRFDPKAGFVPPVLPPAAFRPVEYCLSHLLPRLLAIPVRLMHPTSDDDVVSWPHADAVLAAAMLRHGAMVALNGTPHADWAAGHAPGDDLDARLSWVPLPSIGHHHADRKIRRAVFLARPDAQAEMEALYQALLADRIRLREQENGEVQAIARVAGEQEQQVFAHYRKAGRVWQTVTPIALPGEHATDTRRTRRLVCKALAEAGIEVGLIHSVETSRMPLHPRDPPLSAVRVKAWKAKSTPLVYARIEFTEPLRGPLVIGRGRHYGLGLLCANP